MFSNYLSPLRRVARVLRFQSPEWLPGLLTLYPGLTFMLARKSLRAFVLTLQELWGLPWPVVEVWSWRTFAGQLLGLTLLFFLSTIGLTWCRKVRHFLIWFWLASKSLVELWLSGLLFCIYCTFCIYFSLVHILFSLGLCLPSGLVALVHPPLLLVLFSTGINSLPIINASLLWEKKAVFSVVLKAFPPTFRMFFGSLFNPL